MSDSMPFRPFGELSPAEQQIVRRWHTNWDTNKPMDPTGLLWWILRTQGGVIEKCTFKRPPELIDLDPDSSLIREEWTTPPF